MQSFHSASLPKTSGSLSRFNDKKWKQKQTLPTSPVKYKSVLTKNMLTKSFFSLNDTSFNRLVQKKLQNKPFARRKSTAQLLQRYNRQKFDSSKKIQRVNSEIIPRERQPSIFFADKGNNKQKLVVPKVSLKKSTQQDCLSNRSRRFQSVTNLQNKFKLLFKEQKKRLSVSQRKIIKLDRKIEQLKFHRQKMEKIIPIQKKKETIEKPKPLGVIISKQKITKLIDNLLTTSEGLFHIFAYPNRVGSRIRKIQGYNKKIKQIFMQDQFLAKRITDRTDIQKLFWIFKPESGRTLYFGQEDQALYTMLNNFNFRLAKAYQQQKRNFGSSQASKVKNNKSMLAKQFQKFQKRNVMNQKMQQITKSVENRKIHNQQNRQRDMKFLQKLGVRFNITERTKGLVLTQRQKAIKSFKLQDFKGKDIKP